jgi:hypothetical protein
LPITEAWFSAKRQVRRAQIILDKLGTRLTCEVHNGSRAGATLRVNRAANVPSSFDLEMQPGETLSCTVVRRSRIDISVRFQPV